MRPLPLSRTPAALLLVAGGCGLFGPGGDDGPDDDDDLPPLDGPRGDADSFWKRARAELTVIPSDGSMPVLGEVDLPATLTLPTDGRQVDVYVQVSDDALVTWAWIEGDAVHHRWTEPLTRFEDTWMGGSAEVTRMFALDDGYLVETTTQLLVDTQVLSVATHVALDGAFPPAGWPTDRVDAELNPPPQP